MRAAPCSAPELDCSCETAAPAALALRLKRLEQSRLAAGESVPLHSEGGDGGLQR